MWEDSVLNCVKKKKKKKKKPTTYWFELDSEDIAYCCYLWVSDTGFSRLLSL